MRNLAIAIAMEAYYQITIRRVDVFGPVCSRREFATIHARRSERFWQVLGEIYW